jgi:ElaB/YqjD/DUF883 family membrane-anchored ribosome-binding protein
MQNHTTAATREALIKDVDKLKRDTVQITQDVKEHATAHVDEARKKVNDSLQAVRDGISEHPFAILGIGLFVGFLFGLRHRSS